MLSAKKVSLSLQENDSIRTGLDDAGQENWSLRTHDYIPQTRNDAVARRCCKILVSVYRASGKIIGDGEKKEKKRNELDSEVDFESRALDECAGTVVIRTGERPLVGVDTVVTGEVGPSRECAVAARDSARKGTARTRDGSVCELVDIHRVAKRTEKQECRSEAR
jgi:hypothetical protein